MKATFIQYSTTTSGGVIDISDTQDDVMVIHEAALAATMTINLPPTPVNGQRVTVLSTGGITLLSLSASVGSIINSITTIGSGSLARYLYYAPQNKWYKF